MTKCTVGLKIYEKANKVANWCRKDLSRLETSIYKLQNSNKPYPIIQAELKFNLHPRKSLKAESVVATSNGGIWGSVIDSLLTLQSELEGRKFKGRIKKQSANIIDIVGKEIICYGVSYRVPHDRKPISNRSTYHLYQSDLIKLINGDCTECPYFK